MELNAIQLAGLTAALATLKNKPDYGHPIPLLRRFGGDEVVKEVKALHGEYVQANKDAESGGVAMLSGDAAAYWEEARGVLAYGRMVKARPSRRAEMALSKKCENLDASFALRVPQQEQGMFLIHDINTTNDKTWDDRWHACIDGSFPLLRRDLGGSPPVKHPMNEAQSTVLAAIVCPIPDEPARKARASQWGEHLRALAQDAEESQKVADAAAARRSTAKKAADAKSKKAAADTLIASGDQKATKGRRKRDYKLVKDEAWMTDPEMPAKGL